MTTTTPPNDAATGRRITHDLAANFIIEAGAGTGKTYALVSRVVALVKAGVPMPNIVAITFTEAAAAELSERIRSRLEQLLTPDHPDNKNDLLAQDLTETHRRRIQTAIAELDQASIQTIHSFAAQLLRERPLAAGLPPGWATLDEVEASKHFTDRWDRWLDWALGRDTSVDSDLQDNLRLLLEAGTTPNHWQKIAETFSDNADKMHDKTSIPDANLGSIVEHTLQQLRELQSLCCEPSDAVYRQIARAIASAEKVLQVASDPVAAASMDLDFPSGRGGRADNWDINPQEARNNLNNKIRKPFLDAVRDAPKVTALIPLLHSLRQKFALNYAAQRKADGVATFDDLLVWARDLLRDNAEARAHFRHKYSHILIDEFQDTDPLQAEIAFYLAAAPDAPIGRQDWHTLPLEPGRLFIVGDPKQSIYRFRGADIRVVQQVKDGGQLETLSISENRRSQKPVLDWVNAIFGGPDDAPGLMQRDDKVQAEYIPIHPNAGIQQDGLGSVQVFGGPQDSPADADSIRRRQAVQVANLIAACARPGPDRLNVYDKDAGTIRPASLRDVCILIRSRTGLNTLTRALESESARIPYRLEGASMFFAAQEIRDLLNCLRAIDDPSDEVSVVAALRSPAFACSDSDLLRWRDAGGRWRYSPTPPDTDSPVPDGLRIIHDYHEKSRTSGVARLIADFIRERRLDELDLAESRPREIWRRRQFLVAQARSLEYDSDSDSATAPGAAPLTLSKFLRWAQTREDENARITEVAVPEADDDAVRIMTMHAAKGLEFPIVILTGLDGSPRNRSESALFKSSGGPAEVKAGDLQTPGYPDLVASEKAHAAAEQIRLAYVAATRARDHLLVSLHHPVDKNGKSETLAHRIATMPHLPHNAAPDSGMPAAPPAGRRRANGPEPDPPYDFAGWQQSRNAAIARRALPQSVTATGIANDGKEHEPGPRQRGRGGRSGTAFGSALHAVLQNILDAMLPELPLPPGQSVDAFLAEWQDRIERQAAAQADNNAIPANRRGELVSLTRTALRHPAVAAALRAPRLWPEIPVSAPIDTPQGPVVIEGIIDLLYQDDAGQLVILDYKSDDLTAAELETRLPHYHQQGAAYAAAVASATGKTVRDVRFLFVRLDTVHSVPNLPDHIARLPARIAVRA